LTRKASSTEPRPTLQVDIERILEEIRASIPDERMSVRMVVPEILRVAKRPMTVTEIAMVAARLFPTLLTPREAIEHVLKNLFIRGEVARAPDEQDKRRFVYFLP